ncbi:hypothetical protein D3C80_1993600 [compost metagenome]
MAGNPVAFIDPGGGDQIAGTFELLCGRRVALYIFENQPDTLLEGLQAVLALRPECRVDVESSVAAKERVVVRVALQQQGVRAQELSRKT